MTFRIKHDHLRHQSGTKDYFLLLLVNEQTNKALFVTRWGKVGTAGQVKVERGTFHEADRAHNKKLVEKTGRNYGRANPQTGDELTWGDHKGEPERGVETILAQLGMTQAVLGKADLQWLYEGASEPRNRQSRLMTRDPVEDPPEPPAAPETAYAEDPQWGMF